MLSNVGLAGLRSFVIDCGARGGVLSIGSTSASALPPGYVRLNEGDVVFVAGTKFICAVQQQSRNIASPVVGIICALGTSAGPTPGWVALRGPNDVVVTRAMSSNRSSQVFARSARLPNAYSSFTRPLTLPTPKLLDVHDIEILCTVQATKQQTGRLAISCWFTTPSTNGRSGGYGFTLTEKSVEVLRLGRGWQVVWSHAEPG